MRLLFKRIVNFTGKLLQNCKQLECEIFRILLKHVSHDLSMLFEFSYNYIFINIVSMSSLTNISPLAKISSQILFLFANGFITKFYRHPETIERIPLLLSSCQNTTFLAMETVLKGFNTLCLNCDFTSLILASFTSVDGLSISTCFFVERRSLIGYFLSVLIY